MVAAYAAGLTSAVSDGSPVNTREKEAVQRAAIVSVAAGYVRRCVRYLEPVPDHMWNRRDVEPDFVDCSSLVARVRLVVFGESYRQLGDPSAEVWAGGTPTDPRTLQEVHSPHPGDPRVLRASR